MLYFARSLRSFFLWFPRASGSITSRSSCTRRNLDAGVNTCVIAAVETEVRSSSVSVVSVGRTFVHSIFEGSPSKHGFHGTHGTHGTSSGSATVSYVRKNTLLAAKGGCNCTPLTPPESATGSGYKVRPTANTHTTREVW